MLLKNQSEVRLHTGRSVHFHPAPGRCARPSFSIFRGSGSETTYAAWGRLLSKRKWVWWFVDEFCMRPVACIWVTLVSDHPAHCMHVLTAVLQGHYIGCSFMRKRVNRKDNGSIYTPFSIQARLHGG